MKAPNSSSTFQAPSTPFEFDHLRVEPDRNALISEDGETRLGSRVMSVLVFLAGSDGRVVSRRELLETVWDGRAVTDDALTVAIHDLRKVLGDRPSEPRYVETIPGRGYRWLVPVRDASEASAPGPAAPGPAAPEPSAPEPSAPGPAAPDRSSSTRPRLLVVVGLVLGIAAGLAVGRQDGWKPAAEPEPEPETVRFTAGTINPEIPQAALDAYHEGLDATQVLTPESLRRAADHLETAATLAPEFAMAHIGLAEVLLNLSYFPTSERAELSLRARAEAREALALDPTLPTAHLLQGILRLFLDWDLEGAEEDLWRAIQLDPDYAPSHERYARVLTAQGRFDVAEVRLRHAVHLAPSSRRYAMGLGRLLVYRGRPEEALEVLTADGWDPPILHHAWIYRSAALRALGRDAEACDADLELLRRSLPDLDTAPYRRACDRGGTRALRELWLDTLEEQTGLYLRAVFSVEVGREEEALAWLWQMHRERDPRLLWAAHDPSFRALAGHPELERLLDAVRPYAPDDPPTVSATSHPSWAVRTP